MKLQPRSLLFTPADAPRKMAKAVTLPADAVIADLEDAIAPGRKEEARALLVDSFGAFPPGGPRRCVRINPVDGPYWPADLVETFPAFPDAYLIPKVESARDLRLVDERLTALEAAAGRPRGAVGLLAIVETAAGVMNLREIAGVGGRLGALALGAEDFALDIGARRTRAGWEVFYARSAVVTAAAAFGLQAIDTVVTDLNDDGGLAAECERVRGFGFRGKLAVHPRQLQIINAAFSPTRSEVEAARRLVAEFEKQGRAGRGVCVLDGKMVDLPVYRAARNLLESAHEWAAREEERAARATSPLQSRTGRSPR